MKKTPLKRKTPLKSKTGLKTRKATKKRATGQKRANKKPSIRLLKDKLWKECKRIIRERHGNTCYTCGANPLEGSNWQTGHFIPSSICSTEMRYDLNNLRPQCMRCNIHLSGNWPAYEKHLLKDNIDIQGLKDRNEKTKGQMYRADWYLAKIEEYKQL